MKRKTFLATVLALPLAIKAAALVTTKRPESKDYMTQGITSYIKENGKNLDWKDPLTEAKFDKWLEEGPCRYASTERVSL